MAIAARRRARVRAVLFDLDEALLVRAPAWRYALEEGVASVTGRRIDASPLVAEYRTRPWRHALSIVLDDAAQIAVCESRCSEMLHRSALKRLLVHDGLGMALDGLRGDQVEVGAISHEAHAIALRQVQSTGLDRFLSVLSATPLEQTWDAAARLETCRAFLECGESACAFVSGSAADLVVATEAGYHAIFARWATSQDDPAGFAGADSPAALVSALLA